MLNGTHIEPNFESAVSANLGYGLDVNNPNYITYCSSNITIELLGSIMDILPQSLKVSLKIFQTGTRNPLEIYRGTQINLFDENQVSYVIQKASEKLSLETTIIKNVLYDFIERLDSYRRHGQAETAPSIHVPISIKTEAEKILKADNVIKELKQTLERAGISDTRLGVQLFILSLSRRTKYPLHAIIQAPKLLGNTLLTEFLSVLPDEQTHELTSISKHALSYAPSEEYWKSKTLVLHQLESIKNKGNTLLEYLMQGKSLRLVTQADTQTGAYHSEQKNVTTSINLLSYSNEDYHPLFTGKYSVCIPLSNLGSIKDKLYEKEIKELAGLFNTEEQKHAGEVLQQVAREIGDYQIYNPIMEQIEVSAFFGNNPKEISKYLKLVNLITLMHQKKQNPTLTKTSERLEVKKEYMILGLELFREIWIPEDEELCFRVASTFLRLKKLIKKNHPTDYHTQTFKQKDIRKELGMSPVTLSRHINTLDQYGKIEKCGGSKNKGFEYTIVEWDECNNKEAFENLIQELDML